MASFQKFNAFVEALAEGKHDLSADQLKVALSNTAPNAANSVLADITQISYTNLSSRDLTVASSSQTSGLYKLVINDLVLTASGSVPTFRYVILYNDTALNDELIGFYDIGVTVTMVNLDTFTINFDGGTGVLQLT